MDTLGKRLAFLLQKHLMSAGELARHLEIPSSYLASLLSDRQLPQLHEAILLAEYFGVSLDWLVTGRGHMERHEEYNYQAFNASRDPETSGKIDLKVNEDVVLPGGKIVKERRSDFRSPFVKEILQAIRKLSPDQRRELLSFIHLTFSTESN